MRCTPGITATDRLLAVTTYSFDIAGLELYLPLIAGATCYLCSLTVSKDAELLKNEIDRVRPTIMQATPTTWSLLLQVGWQNQSGVRILCGGEALPSVLRKHFVEAGWEAWNLYGPTETTIWSTIERVKTSEGHSIGSPIANTQVYVLDKYRQPAPILVQGELFIAGAGLSSGYYRQPQLTAEKFIDNPFHAGTKLYATGDLACRRIDGKIEYLGRIDSQIKVRGYRIELGEIEAALSAFPQIASCAVVAVEHDNNRYLAAYYVVKPKAESEDSTMLPDVMASLLRDRLRVALPEYMIPSKFTQVDALPLTPNEKIDRKQLVKIAQNALAEQSKAARQGSIATPKKDTAAASGVENRLLEIWKGVLAVENVRTDEGFFDAGGNSVLAVSLAAQIGRCFDCSFSVTEIFRFSTVQKLTRRLMELQGVDERTGRTTDALPDESKDSGRPSHISKDFRTAIGSNCYSDSVAIIGISCQLPGASDHRAFWQNIITGKESIQFLSRERLQDAGVQSAILSQPNYVPAQATIVGKELFDA